ncbi:hypothetical protein DFH11DRAFT_1582822 [Phellopilus nigrolimitatus]|nr:hypothetical protein DFH11DRAFT_1582822 [Phellopilus nigrolimitatus]
MSSSTLSSPPSVPDDGAESGVSSRGTDADAELAPTDFHIAGPLPAFDAETIANGVAASNALRTCIGENIDALFKPFDDLAVQLPRFQNLPSVNNANVLMSIMQKLETLEKSLEDVRKGQARHETGLNGIKNQLQTITQEQVYAPIRRHNSLQGLTGRYIVLPIFDASGARKQLPNNSPFPRVYDDFHSLKRHQLIRMLNLYGQRFDPDETLEKLRSQFAYFIGVSDSNASAYDNRDGHDDDSNSDNDNDDNDDNDDGDNDHRRSDGSEEDEDHEMPLARKRKGKEPAPQARKKARTNTPAEAQQEPESSRPRTGTRAGVRRTSTRG